MSYAENTKVSVSRSQEEIRKILSKYKASAMAFAESKEKAMIQFEMNGKRVKFVLPLPVHGVEKIKVRNYLTLANEKQIEQMKRSKWRSLSLAIKAKLECVDAGITTLEQEFMAHILLPNGSTVGDVVMPEIEASYSSKQMPPLLGMR